ncbi:MAG: NAD(P)H-hydrate dehydratase, partial [Candidatus Margulisiibacteriota bacterium]
AGLVYLSVPKEIQNPINIYVPEIITMADASVEQMRSIKLSAVGVGPGIGADKKNIVGRLTRSDLKCPLIIDADGLNAISNNPAVLLKRKCAVIITPHPGEMARLLKTTVAKIQEDRVNIALKAAKEWNVIVVLKGAFTVIADPSGRHFINTTGNPGLATAGTGDVLTGMICGLAGQGIEPFSAAACGAFIHGMCGDAVALNKGQRGMIASDIIEAIPFVINSIIKAA